MLQIVSLIVINLLGAAFIGFLMGFIVGKSLNAKTSKDIKSVDKISLDELINQNKEKTKDTKPFVLKSAYGNKKDNLRKIKGIDSQIEKKLNDLGIFHFKQIANWSIKNCEWIEEHLSLTSIVTDFKWIEQAKILETGRETLFSKKINDDI